MERTVSATEARVHFGEILDSVAKRSDVVWVERSGTPQVVIVSVDMWKHLRAPAEDPWEKADRLIREADEYFERTYGPGHVIDFDIEEDIRASREERARQIDESLR
jgi:prevent-host-death family protein